MANGDVFHEAQSFFDPNGRPAGDLISLQVDPTSPTPTGLASASSMVLTSLALKERMAHFQNDLYDLRDSSHLTRFMAALLGDSGAGQLRKRNLITQFQTTMQGTHFYDLDRFYGAIFGASRTIGELLGFDPATDTATANEWDTAADADAAFRDRIFDLAAAINLGATYDGIKSAAEALTRVDCDVYEVWDLLDTYGPGGPGRTWGDVETIGSWDDIEDSDPSFAHPTWDELENRTVIGRTETNSRSEVIVVPKKDYDQIVTEEGPTEAARARLEDEHSIIRVLNKIKPASVLLTVDPDGVSLHREAAMASLWADSNFWYVSAQVVPNPTLLSPSGQAYPLSIQQAIAGVLASSKHEIPKPPWSVQQAARWSYAAEVVSAKVYAFDPDLGTDGVRVSRPPQPPPVTTTTTSSSPPLYTVTFNVNQFDSTAHQKADLVARMQTADILMLQETVHLDLKSFVHNMEGWSAHQIRDGNDDGHANTSILYRTALGPVQGFDIAFVGDDSDTRPRYLVAIKLGGIWYVSVHIFPDRDADHIPEQIDHMKAWSQAHSTPQVWGLDKNQATVGALETTGLHWHGIDIDGFLISDEVNLSEIDTFPSGFSDHPGVHAITNTSTSRTVTHQDPQPPEVVSDPTLPGEGAVVDTSDYDTITYQDNTREKFTADRGVLDPRRALAARYAAEGILISGAYSGPRQTPAAVDSPGVLV